MKAKTKIMALTLAICLVATVGIVAAFALKQTMVSTSFKVTFNSIRDVQATVAAESYLLSSSVYTPVETPTGITFTGKETADEQKKSIAFNEEVVITSPEITANFVFTITNKSTKESLNELVIEPSVLGADVSGATIKIFYMTHTVSGYRPFDGNYTYVELAQNRSIRLKIQVKIDDNATNDVNIDEEKVAFTFHSRSDLPADYEQSALKVTGSWLFDYDEIVNHGSAGASRITLGEYPQNYVGESLNDKLKTAGEDKLIPTGKTYTTEKDGVATKHKEYVYEGAKYVKVESSTTDSATGEVTDTTKFYKVEPIVFVVNKNEYGEIVWRSECAIISHRFDKPGGTVLWENSEIRQFLNDTFIKEAGLNNLITETVIDNNDANGGGAVTGNETIDKLYLHSEWDCDRVYQSSLTNTGFARVGYTELKPSRSSIDYILGRSAKSGTLVFATSKTIGFEALKKYSVGISQHYLMYIYFKSQVF